MRPKAAQSASLHTMVVSFLAAEQTLTSEQQDAAQLLII